MKIFSIFLMILCTLLLVSGCASKEQVTHEKQDKKTVEIQKIEPKAEEKDQLKVEIQKEPANLETLIPAPVNVNPPVKIEEPVVAAPAKETLVAGDTRLILIFKTNELIEPEERAEILKTLKEKWLKGKEYQEIDAKDFDIEKVVGRTVISAEARRAYAKYEFTIRTGKMVQDGKDVVEEPLSKEFGPDCIIDNRDSLENLIKEIQFAE